MSDAGEAPLLLHRSDGVAWITLNRPERMNAFAGAMRDQLADAVQQSSADPGVRVIVIRGAGRAFSAGADVEVMRDLVERGDHTAFSALVHAGMRVVRQIVEAPQPVIAAVNGVAVGAGASLATACDLRIASDRSSIGFTFNRIGLHPDWGATYFLPRRVGAGRAAELIFSGRVVKADEAERMGLFERVAPDDLFNSEVERLAAELAAKPPLPMARAKRTLLDAGARAELEEAMRQENEAQLECFLSQDVREGLSAFFEKRAPVFRGA